MAKRLDPKIGAVLKEHGFGTDACWDCHGTWVIYHRVLEQIAMAKKIEFDPPLILEANGKEGVAAICVTGRMNGTTIWSIGEASPQNNKNSYCWAMAEKRAMDRVILKLIGLHGLAYSEEEADAFKSAENMKPSGGNRIHGPLKVTELKGKMREFAGDLATVGDDEELAGLLNSYQDVLDQCMRDLPAWWFGDGDGVSGAQQRIEEKRGEVKQTILAAG